jgi:Na+-driven multidrug efflux pump
MLIWVLGQTRSAISAIISQHLCRKIRGGQDATGSGHLLNIGLSLLILFSTIFVVEEIFQLLNAWCKILQYCISYYSIRVWGFPLTLFVSAVMGIFRDCRIPITP